MTEKATPLDLTALRQHMLGQMGVGLWASQKGRVYELPPVVADRLSVSARFWQMDSSVQSGKANPDTVQGVESGLQAGLSSTKGGLGGALNDEIEKGLSDGLHKGLKQNPSLSTHDDTKNPNFSQNPQAPSIYGQAQTSQSMPHQRAEVSRALGQVPSQSTRPAINVPKYLQGLSVKAAAFEYWGLRYGAWLLLADASHMDTAARGVWQSLAEALKKQSDKTVALRLKYPLVVNDYPEYQHYEQGHHALLGFFLRLCADGIGQDEPPFSVLCLTPFGERVDFGGLLTYKKDAPSLRQMWETPEYKKQLWQMLHGVG